MTDQEAEEVANEIIERLAGTDGHTAISILVSTLLTVVYTVVAPEDQRAVVKSLANALPDQFEMALSITEYGGLLN